MTDKARQTVASDQCVVGRDAYQLARLRTTGDKVMPTHGFKAYRSESGVISLATDGRVRIWERVVRNAQSVTRVGPLAGWGRYTELYCVVDEIGNPALYATYTDKD